MWTGRLAMGLALLSTPLMAGGDEGHAWWLDATFPPSADPVAAQLREGWTAMTLLDEAMLPPGGAADLRETALRLAVLSDLDGDGEPERVHVGTYRDGEGREGRMLAIFHHGEVRAVFTAPGPPGFSAVHVQGQRIDWYDCLQCGSYERIVRTGDGYGIQ